MAQFQDLPEENIFMIFSYLNPWEFLSCRRVSQSWSKRLVGCGSFTCSLSPSNFTGSHSINGVWIKGHRRSHQEKVGENHTGETTEAGGGRPSFAWRTMGQLPEPLVLSTRTQLSNEKPFDIYAKGRTVAFRMEKQGNRLIWDTADISLSSCVVCRSARVRKNSNEPYALIHKRTKPLLKRVLLRADLGSIQYLQRLSLCGCSLLQKLHLPPNLQALDVSSCSNLTTIIFPSGQRGKLDSLNLRGCRALEATDRTRLFGAATADVMRHIRDIDLCSTKRISSSILADALLFVLNLESISLRYVASDTVIRALAESEAAKTTLVLVDVSFSAGLNDEACETLVNTAAYLERLNLRGCTKISSALFNSVPIWLGSRRGEESNELSLDFASYSSRHQNRRKGDVVFHFTTDSK